MSFFEDLPDNWRQGDKLDRFLLSFLCGLYVVMCFAVLSVVSFGIWVALGEFGELLGVNRGVIVGGAFGVLAVMLLVGYTIARIVTWFVYGGKKNA